MYDDKDFVALLQKGDELSWRQFIDEYKNKLFRTALSYIPFTQEAEDLVQEVFLEVHRSIHKFRAESTLSTWLYRITVNKSINYLKQNKKYFANKPIEDYFLLENQQQISGEDASTRLLQKEQRKIIQQAIDKLPSRQSSVFVLHKIDGKSYKEIAEILDISLSSVESLMFRARISLQKHLIELYRQINS